MVCDQARTFQSKGHGFLMQVCTLHAKLTPQDGDFYISDLGSANGTWLNGDKMKKQDRQRVRPGDEIVVGQKGVSGLTFKIKQVHNSVWDQLSEIDPQENRQQAVAA